LYDNIFTSTNLNATVGNFAWIPLGLTFTVPADGEYEVFLGFVEHPEPGSWYGGVDVSAPALYEYTAPVIQIDPPALAASDGTVVLGDGTATLSAAMSVGELKGKLSVNEPYLIYVTDASGAEKADSAQVAAGDKVIVKNGDETVAAYSVAISGPDSTQTGNKGCGSCGGGASALFSAAALLAALFALKKRLP
jgi:hypothetical protein